MKTNKVRKFIKCTLVNMSTQKFKGTFSIPVEVERKEYSGVNISKCFLSLFYSSMRVKYNLCLAIAASYTKLQRTWQQLRHYGTNFSMC